MIPILGLHSAAYMRMATSQTPGPSMLSQNSKSLVTFPKTTPNFNHVPLLDPKTKIRLLRVSPGRKDDNIEIELSIWDIQLAPEYLAISYTWGDDRERVIFINGLPFWVRQNCHYALWQARIHHHGQYIWLDSICIDQGHSQEKSHQVSIMKDIYVRASLVLASIGPHEDYSEFLIKMLATMRSRGCDITATRWFETWEDSDAKVSRDAWFSGLNFSQEDLTNLRTALTALPARRYWKRLWIVQEIAAADERVQFLCGPDVFSWDDFVLILYLSGYSWDFHGCPSALWTVPSETPRTQHLEAIQYARLAYTSLDSALSNTAFCRCSDPRDRVFGILPLIEWPGNNSGITPDYNKSCFQVAFESFRHLRELEQAFALFNTLDLSCFQPEMLVLRVKERRETEMTKVRGSGLGWSAIISADEEGNFKVSVAYRDVGDDCFDYTFEELSSQVSDMCQESTNASRLPKPLMSTTGPVGFICPDAAPGDMILSMSRMCDTHVLHLVVREAVRGSYDVIGQAFFLPHFRIFNETRGVDISLEGTRSSTNVQFELNLTTADLIYLVGQDYDHGICDVQARAGRLSNNPFSSPLGAVTIWPKEDQEIEDLGNCKDVSSDAYEEADDL